MTDQRFEAAKAAMQGFLSRPSTLAAPQVMSSTIEMAIAHADELLARLKETKPKGIRCTICDDEHFEVKP